ncbi:MAG: HAD family phosphatase [Treponema sp.]|nr:HAD family phosphatase [Treponema sp.]
MTKLPEKKLPVKLIALDLDDTLLNDSREISDENVHVLRRAASLGIYVVLCSGRAEDAILPFVRRLDLAGTQSGRYIIAVNGCSIFDMHKRERIYNKKVAADVLLYADRMAREMGYYSEVYGPDVIYAEKSTEWTRLDSEMCGVRLEIVEDYENFLRQGFVKMLIAGEPEKLQVLQKKLRDGLKADANIFVSKPYFLEVLPANCGKGQAVNFLADHLGISRKETIGFGDSMNDEDMIRECGYGVAMCNGFEEIKDIADFVTEKTNDENGVGDFLKKYVL